MLKLPPYQKWPAPWRKWGVRVGIAFVLYSVIGFFILPPILRSQLEKRLARATHRPAKVRQVRVNPLALSLTVRGLAVTETNGAPFVSFEEFYANFQLSSLFRWAWTFDELKLKEPRADIVLDAQGQFNFADLLAATNTPPPATKPATRAGVPRLLVFNLVVTNGHVGFADLTHKKPFRTAYAPIDFNLKQFSTKPDRRSPYAFEASSDTGRGVAWSGTVTAQPPGSSGTLRIGGVQLPKHAPYLEDFTRAQLVEGTADVGGDYFVELGTNGLDLVVSNFLARVSGLKLQDPDSGETVLSVASYEQRDCGLDYRTRRARIGSLIVSEPAVLARRRADGSINLLSLLVPPPAKPAGATNTAPGESWELALEECRVERGSVQLEDAAVPGPFRALLQPLSLRLEHFTTRSNSDAALRVGFTTDAAETFDLEGKASINPQQVAGALKINGVELKRYQPYLAPFFRGRINSGKTDLALDFEGRRLGELPEAVVSNLVLHLVGLEIKAPQIDETVVRISELVVSNTSASLAERAVRVESVDVEKATVLARREKDGAINLLGLLSPAASVTNASTVGGSEAARAGTNAPVVPGWRVTSGRVSLRDCEVRVEDQQTTRPGLLGLDQLALSLEGAQFPSNAPVHATFSVRVNERGAVSSRGTLWPYTPAAEMDVDVAGLELAGFQPWIDTQVKLGVVSGALGTHGHVKFGPVGASSPRLHFAGELGVTNLLAQDQVLFKEFVRWTELAVKGIDLDIQPNRAAFKQVRFDGLKTSVIIGPDKRPNVLSVLPGSADATNVAAATGPATAPAPTATTNAPAETFPLQLAELEFANSSFHFADESIQPTCAFDIKQFGGTVKGITSRPGTSSTVALTGLVDEASPFGLHGTVNPLAHDLALNLEFTNRSLQLTPFTTYMEKYAGHALNKGRLTLDLVYSVNQGHLQASNNVRIDQLMLGPRNESPDATKLPVKLAVALLKDRNGQIALDVPVEGRLDDPKFSVGPIILKVILNMITKAATSPFKLLGALVGGGEELSFVEFAAGESRMLDTETNKIEKLGKALANRPALNLEIEASADPALDRDALARQSVREQVRKERLQELATAGQRPADAESFEVEPAQNDRLLRAALVKQHGTNLAAALSEFTASASTNQPAVRPAANRPVKMSFLARLAGWIPFQKKNSPAALARRQIKADAALLKQNPQMAALTSETMEAMLAAKTEVPADAFLHLMQARAAAMQAALLKQGEVTPERLFLIAPKPPEPSRPGQARVNLSLN